MQENYQRELDALIQKLQQENKRPLLLLHSCCGPCSSYVIEYLRQYFRIALYYYNPNIAPPEEYRRRLQEQKQLLEKMGGIENFLEGVYEPEKYYQIVGGMEEEPEGGERCFRCYELRLREAAQEAVRLHADYFTTTLSISPHKNAQKLMEIGNKLSKEYGVPYLVSDFKKKGGFQRSLELSRIYGLYRQDYCGCAFSKREREEKMAQTSKDQG